MRVMCVAKPSTDKTLCWATEDYISLINRVRKSRITLQNKVRIKVVPVQLTLFFNTFVAFKKVHYAIVFFYTILITAHKYTLFHILVMK